MSSGPPDPLRMREKILGPTVEEDEEWWSGTAAAPPYERHGSTPAALQDTATKTKRPPATAGDGHRPTLYPRMRGNRIFIAKP